MKTLSMIAFFLIFSFLFLFISIYFGWFGKLPSIDELKNHKNPIASEIYSADSVLMGKFYTSNRTYVTFDELSPWLVKALIATEDPTFYNHYGVSLNSLQGYGSTITQYVAKNIIYGFLEHNLRNVIMFKIHEYELTFKLERYFTKNEIIAMYFNTVDFLNNADGINSAAHIYFNKLPKDLNVEESAMLVGMLQNPSLYNPKRHEERSRERRNRILLLLYKYNEISKAQYDSLFMLPIKLDFHPENINSGIAPYFKTYLADYLKQWCKKNKKPDGTNWNIYTDGLKIYTTIDSRYQKYAEIAAINNVKRFGVGNYKTIWESKRGKKTLLKTIQQTERYSILKDRGKSDEEIYAYFKSEKRKMTLFSYSQGKKDTTISLLDSIIYYKNHMQTAFMAIETSTGFVKAWVGGANFEFFKYDHCSPYFKRQVGSLFKPIVYTHLIENGTSPCDSLTPLKYWISKSFGGGKPYNIYKNFVVDSVVELSKRMGISTTLQNYPSTMIGSSDLSLYEIMTAYSTFPNAGTSIQPQFITNITDNNGKNIHEFTSKKSKAISDNSAYIMCQILKGPLEQGGTTDSIKEYGIGVKELAGKPGTTNGNTDAWFVGFTPQLIVGVWCGYDDPILKAGQGNHIALPAFGKFMQLVYNDTLLKLNKNKKFFTPSDTSLLRSICK